MYLDELMKKTEKELNKVSKAEIIQSIVNNQYQYTSLNNKVKEAEEKLAKNRTDERAAAVMLAAFVGVELPRSEYTGALESEKLNILELAGLAAQKCADIAR